MPHLIGTDEAGYGPNLGPLTITGTLWDVPHSDPDLYRLLAGTVTNSRANDSGKLFVADSKKVFGGSKKLLDLETYVLAILYSVVREVPKDWRELVDMVCDSRSADSLSNQKWLGDAQLPLPLFADIQQIRSLGNQFSICCEQHRVRLKTIRCATVFAPEFNQGIEDAGNKATLLSSMTLQTVRKLLDLTHEDVVVGCDKHGGRSKYAGLIQEFVTEEYVFVRLEQLESSEYQFDEANRKIDLRFQARGESFLPTVLASMVSKYVREIFMELWNDFWKVEIPGIKPTQGYPLDAKRFKRQIATKQVELGISDRSIWRNK